MLEIIATVILVALSIIGFVAIFFTTFGTLIILIGTLLYGLLTQFTILTPHTLIILCILYLVGETLEYVCVIAGAKKLGASNIAIAGALIGAIGGAFVGIYFAVIGVVVGTLLGIFLGAFLVELFFQKNLMKSLKAGMGGVMGRIGAIMGKVIVAMAMFAIVIAHIAKHIRTA